MQGCNFSEKRFQYVAKEQNAMINRAKMAKYNQIWKILNIFIKRYSFVCNSCTQCTLEYARSGLISFLSSDRGTLINSFIGILKFSFLHCYFWCG